MALTVGTNSYKARADADTYFADTLRAATWAALDNATKDAALIEATTWLETFRYVGERTDTTTPQDLAWPRTGVEDRDGIALDENEIPPDIAKAQYELALLLAGGSVSSTGATTSNVKRQRLDVLEQEFFEAQRSSDVKAFKVLPSLVRDLIKPYLGATGASGAFASGTDEESSLSKDSAFVTPSGQYGRNEGFG